MVALAAAAGAFFGAKEITKRSTRSLTAPPPSQPIETPKIEDAAADAQADVKRRRRISLASGGKTDLTRGGALVSESDVARNSLVGV